MKKNRQIIIIIGLLLILALCFFISIRWGTYSMSYGDIFNTLLGKGTPTENLAVLGIRLPRFIMSVLVGIAFSWAGGTLQTVFKNDLADPGIIGVNSGAALGAVLFIASSSGAYYEKLSDLSIFVLPFICIVSAIIAMFLILFISDFKTLRPRRMLLVGLGVNAGIGAIITAITFQGGVGQYNRVLIWTSGSIWGASWREVLVLFPIILISIIILFIMGRKLDILKLGDETSIGLGLSPDKLRRLIIGITVILAGAAVSFSGNMLFVGLIAPHLARALIGGKHRLFLPTAGIVGAILVSVSDTLCRNLFSPIEIPAGILVSILAVPYFIYLASKD